VSALIVERHTKPPRQGQKHVEVPEPVTRSHAVDEHHFFATTQAAIRQGDSGKLSVLDAG
jgi:hypothetical protein